MSRAALPYLAAPLFERAEHAPRSLAMVFTTEDGERHHIDSETLCRGASRAAAVLGASGVRPGDVVVLAIGHSRALIEAFLGAVALGAVPAIAPYFTGRLDPVLYAQRVERMVEAARATLVVTSADLAERLSDVLRAAGCRTLSAEALADTSAPPFVPPAGVGDDSLAYVQFSSGSTGAQKAVAHTQRAMREYLAAKIAFDAYRSDDVIVSWLPLYHDMGLISGVVAPLVVHVPSVLMSPAHWVRDPKIMFRAFHDFRGTVTWIPNFALSHSARAVRERDLEGIDLSSWRTLVVGSEMVRHESIREFVERFAPYGFPPNAVRSGYGMAENVEGAAATPVGQTVRVDWVKRRDLQLARRASPAEPESPEATAIVSCGVALPGTELRVVGGDGAELPERTVGEIELRSSYCMSGGYYKRPDLTAAALRDGWFFTGDLGYFADGELYLCGRKKDLIIVGGHNVMPDDLERIASQVPGVAAGRVVAFALPDMLLRTDRAAIVCELAQPLDDEARRALEAEIRSSVVKELDVAVSEIRFVDRGWVIKTSSGKLARSANRDKHMAEKGMETR